MKALTFGLDSNQCELLLAFEAARSLGDLATRVSREASVVSRQLQRLAETAPVLEKAQGRWRLTELGKQVNRWARAAMNDQERILRQQSTLRFSDRELPAWLDDAVLVVMGVQRGFEEPVWGRRNNPRAEEKIAALLTAWRKAGRPIVHARHESKLPLSPLRAGTRGAEFMDFAVPREGEIVVVKNANSAFVGTALEATLRERSLKTLVLVGFTTNHCVDATARQASDANFRVFIVSDATVAHDRVGPDGRLLGADEIHAVVLANLHQEFGLVLSAADLLAPVVGMVE